MRHLLRPASRFIVPALIVVLAGCIPYGGEKKEDTGSSEIATPSCCCDGGTSNEDDCCSATSQTGALPISTTAPAKVELKAVKYNQLIEAVRANKGKVVVVDLWATWCPECMKEFPSLVELHQKYADKGLVCISVALDEPEQTAKALKFLKKVNATFANYRLDEKESFYQEKLNINGIPVAFVFDREGRRAAKFNNDDPDNQFTYKKNVAPLVEKLLKTK